MRAFSALALVSVSSGCSDDYSLRAVAKEGRIAFVGDGRWLRQPECVETVEVRADNGSPATTPEPGDDDVLVRLRGVYWSTASDSGSCRNRLPIFYGTQLEGRLPANFPFVAAKPLKTGLVYEVWTASQGSGSGKGWFKILPGGRIENYRTDPTPTLLDEDGWQVMGGQQREARHPK